MVSKEEILRKAKELDDRRQAQIQNQIDSINRLLDNGSYDDEMKALHDKLSQTRVELARARTALEDIGKMVDPNEDAERAYKLAVIIQRGLG